MKGKLIQKIVGVALGLTMAIGVGVAVSNTSKSAVHAATYTYSFTISVSDFNTTSYAANNNEKTTTATCTTDNTKTMDVKWTSYQVMKNGSDMQWQKSKGYIYNSTNLGTITGVTVNSSAGSFTKYYGTSEHPTSGTTVGNGFFTVNVGGATGKTSSIVITFTQTEETTKEATGMTFSPSSLTVSGGDSGSFTPTLTGGTGEYEKTISWTSNNPSIIPAPANSEDGEAVNFTAANPASNTTVTLTGTVVSPGKASSAITITVNHVTEYTITYNPNGGTGTMSNSINKVSANGFTAPSGKEFKEWNTQADGKGTTFNPNDTVSEDTDLYAIWQRLKYTTGFESSEGFTATTAYNTTKVDGPTGKQWQFVNGTAATGNKITGDQSAQLRKYSGTTGNPNINMQFNIDEIHSISFNAKSGTANMGVEVFYSTNNGSTWTSIGTETVGTSVVSVEKEISSYVASGRFKIEYTGANPSKDNKWMSIDDIVIGTQSAEPTVTSVSLSPSDDVTLKVGNSETYEVTISGNNLLGTETVDVVLTDDLGDYVSIDNDSGLKNGDTFTVTATTAEGIGELYISYNSGEVDSAHITVMTEEAKTLSTISVHASGTTSYFTGDVFSKTGFEIYANYTDQTSEDVTSNAVFELIRESTPVAISTPLLKTDTTVRVSYTESGTTKTTDITISVVDDTVKSLSWGNRGTVDCLEGTTLGSAVNTSSWTFTATWESLTETNPTYGTGEGYVHVGLYATSTPESEGTALSISYVFKASDDGKYLVAFYNGVRSNSNKQVTITEELNKIDEPTEASFSIATSISVGDTVYLASAARELSGISTTNTKYGLATEYTGAPNKLYALTVVEGSESNSYAFANSNGKYLSVTNGNTLNVSGTLSSTTSFTVSFDSNGNATIKSLEYTGRSIQYNAASGQERFANYTNDGQTAVQLWKDIPAGTKDIANKNLKVQHVVVEYAKDFSTKLEKICVAYGSTDITDLKNEWADLADQFDNWIKNGDKNLEGNEITLALSMFANADSVDKEKVSTADSLQNMLAKYDWIVSHYKTNCADFLHTEAGRGEVQVASGSSNTIFWNLTSTSNSTAIILIISLISLTAMGGYLYLRKRKEN